MSRRTREPEELFGLANRAAEHFLGSPLAPVADKLLQTLREAKCAYDNGSLSLNKLDELSNYITHVVGRFPQTFGERFFFDSAMIRAIAVDSACTLPLSTMLIPCYQGIWGHGTVVLPSEDLQRTYVVDLIYLPGQDQIEDTNLREYSWLAHELGHHILFHDDLFSRAFLSTVEERIRSLRIAAIADQGAARARALSVLDEITRVWRPTPNHQNWAHELAIDFMSLWTCGPAYLDCFEDTVRAAGVNPFLISQDHPPYAVRIGALVQGARELGLNEYTRGLKGLVSSWGKSPRDNRYFALADSELINKCRQIAFDCCASLKLAKCNIEKINELVGGSGSEPSDELGIDLLLLASVSYKQRGQTAYDNWERDTVKRLATSVR